MAHVGLGGAPHIGGGSTPLVHVGPIQYVVPLLEPSRTFRNLSGTLLNIPELFRNLRKPLSIYESYSPDSSRTSRDVRDPIRNSKSPFVHFIIQFIAKPNFIEALSV